MHDIFFQKKSKLILLALAQGGDKYVSEVAAEVKSTYAHTFNLLRSMEGDGIVKAKKDGRIKYVKLTPRGSKLADVLMNFESILTSTRRPSVKKKREKKTATLALTPTAEKLQRYSDSLSALLKELDSRSRRKNLGKYARLTGRYRSLISRLRPKDKAGKKMKRKVLQLLDEIKSRLDRAREEK
ncbi:MAG: helix-turn-helix domain-containing protein [Candidatus Hydrothermarchaeota archaeon]|nr:helix-turn-helix domain-containing protein [Candidatus Hydrothermarchaeota archaeon]